MSARTDSEAAEVQASSGVTAETLKTKITEQLEATHVEVEDLSGKDSLVPCKIVSQISFADVIQAAVAKCTKL
jgi:hypothetical protein